MKKLKKILFRIFPVVVCISIIFSFTFSVSAANYTVLDYNDYIDHIYVDGDNEIVSVIFPQDDVFWQINSLTGSASLYDYNPNLSVSSDTINDYIPGSNKEFNIVYRPLGFSVLSLDNVPQNTMVRFKLNFRFLEFSQYEELTANFFLQYYDSNMNAITNFSLDVEYADSLVDDYWITFDVSSFINKPAGAKYVMPRFVISVSANGFVDNVTLEVNPSRFFLDLLISSLYRLQEQTKQTNKLLSKLENQNQTIIDQNQNMIDGTPQQNQQVGVAVDGLENSAGKMEDLADDMKVDKPDLSGVDVSPDAIVNVADRALLTAPLTKLWDDPTILGMVTTVFILVLVSWVFFGKKG